MKLEVYSLYLLALGFFILLFSCNAPAKRHLNEEQSDIISILINMQLPLTNAKKVFIIPDAGCMTCISEFEKELIKNSKVESLFDHEILIVLTGITSKKELKLKFGTILDRPNVFVDYENLFLKERIELERPHQIILK